MKNLLDDPGTLIYVAFLAISLIGGYLKNLKKKRATQIEEDIETPEPDPRSYRFEENQVQQASNEIDADKRIAEMKRKSDLALQAKSERESRVRKRKEEMQSALDSESETENLEPRTDGLDEAFDLKKAIIYSEIINTPYV
jgi:hypothetical protein